MRQLALAQADVVAIAGEDPICRPRNQPGIHRVAMDVTAHMHQVIVAVHQDALESALKQRADAVLFLVDGFGVRGDERLHDGKAERGVQQVDQQVIVVGHQTISDDDRLVAGEVLVDALQEECPIALREEDRLPIDAAVVDVVVLVRCVNGLDHGVSSGAPEVPEVPEVQLLRRS